MTYWKASAPIFLLVSQSYQRDKHPLKELRSGNSWRGKLPRALGRKESTLNLGASD